MKNAMKTEVNLKIAMQHCALSLNIRFRNFQGKQLTESFQSIQIFYEFF